MHIGSSLLKDGEEVVLSSGHVPSAAKFDRKLKDDFDIWAANRDQLQSVASYRTASSVGGSYYPGSAFSGMGMGSGSWAFNPMMGFFTYLPYGMMTSPWGYYYYSPSQVGNYPCPSYGYGYGYGYGCGYGGYGYNGNGYGYGSGSSPVRAAIGTTPSSARFPVYGTVGGNGSSSFAGSSPRSGSMFSGNSNSNSGLSGANSASSSGFGGTARAGGGSVGGSSVGGGTAGGGGAAPAGRH